MAGIDKGIKITFRNGEYEEPYRVETKSLYEFAMWLDRMDAQGAEIHPNGMQGVIVMTPKRYIQAFFK